MKKEVFKYSYKDTIKENMGLSVYNTGFQRCEGGYGWGPGVRDHYLIHYVASGKGRYRHGENVYELSAGDLFLIYPMKIVRYEADETDPWEYFWVGFNGDDSGRLLEMTDFCRDNPVIRGGGNDVRYEEYLTRIYDQRGNHPWNDAEMTGTLYNFLAKLIAVSDSKARNHRLPRTYIGNAMRFVHCNYINDISIEEVAGHTGISRSHLYKLFMVEMGISPKSYLMNFRINQACGLLRNGEMSVSQIAASVGFKDPLYFSRIFRQIKGVPPSGMKKENIP